MWVETQNMVALGMGYFGRIHGEHFVTMMKASLC